MAYLDGQTIVVPLIDGIFGATVPALTWFGALLSLIGVGILEYGGSPPSVSSYILFVNIQLSECKTSVPRNDSYKIL